MHLCAFVGNLTNLPGHDVSFANAKAYACLNCACIRVLSVGTNVHITRIGGLS